MENFSKFTFRAVQLAFDEASGHKQQQVGTEYLLLGLLLQYRNTATFILDELGADRQTILNDIYRTIVAQKNQDWKSERDSTLPQRELMLSPDASLALEFAKADAVQDGNAYVGAHSLLFGLLQVETGLACTILIRNGVTLAGAKEVISRLLSG